MMGKEIEVDAICDGEDILIPGIMEHIERAGIHSGDSISIYPPQTLDEHIKSTIVDYTTRLAKALKIVGLFNIQFVIDNNNKVYVIEVNPRASRTIPIMSKVTGIPMVDVATKFILGYKMRDLGYTPGLYKESEYVAVKAPVFSFSKLTTVDTFLGPEMKSTGEVMGVSKDFHIALFKALAASGIKIPSGGNVLLSVADRDKRECVEIAQALSDLGFNLMASEGTYTNLSVLGIEVEMVSDDEMIELIKSNKISLVINTPTMGKIPGRLGFILRRTSIEYNIPCITSLDTARSMISILEHMISGEDTEIYPLDMYAK